MTRLIYMFFYLKSIENKEVSLTILIELLLFMGWDKWEGNEAALVAWTGPLLGPACLPAIILNALCNLW